MRFEASMRRGALRGDRRSPLRFVDPGPGSGDGGGGGCCPSPHGSAPCPPGRTPRLAGGPTPNGIGVGDSVGAGSVGEGPAGAVPPPPRRLLTTAPCPLHSGPTLSKQPLSMWTEASVPELDPRGITPVTRPRGTVTADGARRSTPPR
ncbi:hypothetical protein GCM10010275_53500 [Streptomyces litmocidini]|nr:hypothetical protein GCM10010275_53500 [Streptomyces litmocidini]